MFRQLYLILRSPLLHEEVDELQEAGEREVCAVAPILPFPCPVVIEGSLRLLQTPVDQNRLVPVIGAEVVLVLSLTNQKLLSPEERVAQLLLLCRWMKRRLHKPPDIEPLAKQRVLRRERSLKELQEAKLKIIINLLLKHHVSDSTPRALVEYMTIPMWYPSGALSKEILRLPPALARVMSAVLITAPDLRTFIRRLPLSTKGIENTHGNVATSTAIVSMVENVENLVPKEAAEGIGDGAATQATAELIIRNIIAPQLDNPSFKVRNRFHSVNVTVLTSRLPKMAASTMVQTGAPI